MEEQRKSHKGLWVIGAVVVILLFCAFFFRVKKVSIEGNTYYSSREMEEKFQSNIFEKNILTFWLMQKLSLTPDLPFVREYEVSYPSTNEIHIKLYEKSIVAGIAYSNQYIYFDKDGIVLQSSDKAVKGIPLFETKNLTTFTLYSKVQMEDDSLLNQILNLANLFKHYNVNWDKVVFDSENEDYLYAGEIQVSLGKKENYEYIYNNEKLSKVYDDKIFPMIEEIYDVMLKDVKEHNNDEEISALSSVLAKVEKNGQTGEIDLRNYKVGGDVILKQPKK